MPHLKKTVTSEFSLKQIYELVQDIESYPEFIPWCVNARILSEKSEEILYAELLANFAGISQSYVSKVELFPPNQGNAEVKATMISGPFKYLNTSWRLKDNNGETEISFFIDFEFNSFLLKRLASNILLKACDKMIMAFKKRARNLFTTQSA